MCKPLREGEVILRARITDVGPEYGQAAVAHAVMDDGRPVLVKRLIRSDDPVQLDAQLARFRYEASLRWSHPRITGPIAAGEQDGEHHILFPLVDGVDLQASVKRCGGPLGPQTVAQVAADICDALAHVHERGILHRDVGPSNILVGRDGRGTLIDFGVACARSDLRSSSSAAVGTREFMAPEQAVHQRYTTAASDLYGLGAAVLFALTGKLPRESGCLSSPRCDDTAARLLQLNPTVPARLARWVARALAPDPALRFACARDALAALPSGDQPYTTCWACRRPSGTTNFCETCGACATALDRCPTVACAACGSVIPTAGTCATCHQASPHRLVFHRGPAAGAVVVVPLGQCVIGRQSICPRDGSLSRDHLILLCSEQTLGVSDNRSANGTFVEDARLSAQCELAPGDRLHLGRCTAVYLVDPRSLTPSKGV